MAKTKAPLLIFDVNETLLDLKPLSRRINAVLSNERAFDLWFTTLLHYSLVETVTANHEDFSNIARATFKMTAEKFEKILSEEEIVDILNLIRKLPAYNDVVPGLNNLKEAGFKMVALTNGNLATAKAQLEFAELTEYFTEIISVDSAKAFKPKRTPYEYVLKKFGVSPQQSVLIAAHGWDILGAQRAGLKTCFIRRPGKSLYPLAEKPNFQAANLLDLSKKIIQEGALLF